jgi:GNAT superfamily N-acetyltransferase
MEKIVNYSNPKEQESRYGINYGRAHRFTSKNEHGVVVSGAQAEYLSKPFPHFYIDGVYTDTEFQSQGYTSAVINEIEAFLIEKGKPGLLVDDIRRAHPDVYGMYQRRGWKEVPGTDLLAFNLSADTEPTQLQGYHQRYTETVQRLKNRLDNQNSPE